MAATELADAPTAAPDTRRGRRVKIVARDVNVH